MFVRPLPVKTVSQGVRRLKGVETCFFLRAEFLTRARGVRVMLVFLSMKAERIPCTVD